MAASDARPVPMKGQAYRVTFPIFDADGDLVTGAAGLDSEVSIDGGTFADCTNEATEIATGSGMYYLDLTAAEMAGDTIALIIKTSSSGAKTTPIVLYPDDGTKIRANGVYAGTAQGGGAEYVDGPSTMPSADDRVNDYFVFVLTGPGAGQFRKVLDYTGTSRRMAVRAWDSGQTPDNTSRIVVLGGDSVTISGVVDSNLKQVDDDAGLGAAFKNGVSQAELSGTVTDANESPTTSVIRVILSEALGNVGNINGRPLYWRTGNLKFHRATIISVTDPAEGGEMEITVTTMPEAPADGDVFDVL